MERIRRAFVDMAWGTPQEAEASSSDEGEQGKRDVAERRCGPGRKECGGDGTPCFSLRGWAAARRKAPVEERGQSSVCRGRKLDQEPCSLLSAEGRWEPPWGTPD
ncbi:hypothetical protein ERJ75_001567400 [Trypanosoma vivax]|nr:hypothetical protein ERJ75_001567400 [Trypanosoma vivax]